MMGFWMDGVLFCFYSVAYQGFVVDGYFKYFARLPMRRMNTFKERLDTKKGGNAFGRRTIFFVAGRGGFPMRPGV
ncbi:hypothetical protein TSH58p_19960 (plasmid) [Azospirillum sp. TSH58]|nr:hypothetical protein TSH58p_19960 [Azospirillum sp. TSH58]